MYLVKIKISQCKIFVILGNQCFMENDCVKTLKVNLNILKYTVFSLLNPGSLFKFYSLEMCLVYLS